MAQLINMDILLCREAGLRHSIAIFQVCTKLLFPIP